MTRPRPEEISLKNIIFAGLVAGAVAAAIQLVLWWLFNMPVAETLFRYIRLAAAVLFGADVVAAPVLTTRPTLMMSVFAIVMHLALSVACAAIYAALSRRMPRLLRNAYPVMGALFGLVIYLIKMHGLVVVFPWLVDLRGIATLLAYLAFGAVLAIALRPGGFANPRRRVESRLSQDTILG